LSPENPEFRKNILATLGFFNAFAKGFKYNKINVNRVKKIFGEDWQKEIQEGSQEG